MKTNHTDWLVAIAFGIATIIGIVGNYYYHGGHITW